MKRSFQGGQKVDFRWDKSKFAGGGAKSIWGHFFALYYLFILGELILDPPSPSPPSFFAKKSESTQNGLKQQEMDLRPNSNQSWT